MNQRRRLTVVAAVATLLATLPLASLFDRWTWLVDAILIVAATSGGAFLARSLRAPAWLVTLVAVLGYLIALCWRFPSGREPGGLLPVPGTLTHWADLLSTAGREARELSIPVADHDGLLFLTMMGIGTVAILVDLFAVVHRRPALAGLPMLAIYSVPVAVQTDSVSVLPFAAGAAGFLWLLVTDHVDRMRHFGRRFTAEGRDVDVWESSPLAAAGRRLAAAGVLLAILLPLAVPGMTSGLLDRFGTVNGIGGGFGRGNASVNLYAHLRGILNQEHPYEMARVSTNDPDPYYLRFAVAGEASEAGFHSRPSGGGQPVTSGFPSPVIAPTDGVRQAAFHARIQIVNLDLAFLPVYLQPTRTDKLDSSWMYDRAGQTIYATRGSSKGKTYAFDYVRTEFTPAALRAVAPMEPDASLPANTALPRRYDEVTAIVEALVAGKATQYDRVLAIFQYFSAQNGFVYRLETGSTDTRSPIVDFLHNKKGFCEQYSAAMAWLLRAAGIPARVAFGFTRGRPLEGDTYSLTNENLHAWTEVYFQRFGWVPFDPTPGVAIAGAVSPAWQRPEGQPAGPSSGSADNPRNDARASGAASLRPDEPGPQAGTGTIVQPHRLTQWAFWARLAVLGALALLIAPPLWRAVLRRRRWPGRRPIREPAGADVRRRAHAAWDELIDTMVDHRLLVDAAATPRAIAGQLADQVWLSPTAAGNARLLCHAEERARYARQPQCADELGTALQAVRRAILERMSRRTRVLAILMPPSVLRRWRANVTLNHGRPGGAANAPQGGPRRWDAWPGCGGWLLRRPHGDPDSGPDGRTAYRTPPSRT